MMNDDVTKSQEQQVLRRLLAGESLTALEALRSFGVFRLAARVFRLRQKVYAMAPEWLKKLREDAEACHD